MNVRVVNIVRKNGKIVDVQIIADVFSIIFTELNDVVIKKMVARYDREKLRKGDLFIPEDIYSRAIRTARAIFAQNKRQ